MSKQYWKPGNMLYPVPAVMLSCQREGEKPNIITVAWAGTICTNPPMLSVSIRPERYSYPIIQETGEFVVNLVTKDLVYATDYCGVRSGSKVDKFAEMHLTPLESKNVKAPSIAESPVNIECKVVEIKELGSHHLFIAEVVGVTVDEEYMNETGKFELNSCGLVAYSHGEYFELGEKVGKFGYSVRKEMAANTEKTASEKDSASKEGHKKASGKKKNNSKTAGKKEFKKKDSHKNKTKKKELDSKQSKKIDGRKKETVETKGQKTESRKKEFKKKVK